MSNKTSTAPSIELDLEDAAIQEPPWKPQAIELLIMITMAVSSLVVALDSGILIPVLPTLTTDLNGTTSLAFWTGTSYLLAHAVLQPTISSLSTIFGRRELLIPSLLSFLTGSIICALSQSFTTLLTGRTIQGIGGAGIISLSQLVYADIVPLRQRPKYFSIVLGAWALGSLTGPLIGGLLASSWRWCFWINLPLCALALPLSLSLGRLKKPRAALSSKLAAIDWFGNTLFIASTTSLLIGTSWAGVSYSWTSYQTLTPLILGICGLLATILYEISSKTPFLNRQIFTNISVVACYFCAALQGMALYMSLYFITFYFSAVLFFSPTRAGYSLIPASLTILPGSAITNILITRLGVYRPFLWLGFLVSTGASGCLIVLDEHTKIPVWAAILCCFGAGMGMLVGVVNVSIQASVAPEVTGEAAVMYAFFRSVGMAVGVSVGGTVFQNQMRRKLEDLGVEGARELARDAEGFVQVVKNMSVSRERERILEGYVGGFRGVWVTMTVLLAVGLVVSAVVRKGELNQKLSSRFSVQGGKKSGGTR